MPESRSSWPSTERPERGILAVGMPSCILVSKLFGGECLLRSPQRNGHVDWTLRLVLAYPLRDHVFSVDLGVRTSLLPRPKPLITGPRSLSGKGASTVSGPAMGSRVLVGGAMVFVSYFGLYGRFAATRERVGGGCVRFGVEVYWLSFKLSSSFARNRDGGVVGQGSRQ